MILNKNNFLIWDGAFTKAPFDVIAGNHTHGYPQGGQLQYEIDLLPYVTATYGVDESTIEVYMDTPPSTRPVFSLKRQKVIYYADSKNDSGAKLIKYKFKDKAGHQSNEGILTIDIGERFTNWIGYPPSATCTLSGGTNTGIVTWMERYKIYQDSNEPVIPLVIVDNTIPDADQVLPAQDMRFCPLIALTANVTIINNSDVVSPFIAEVTVGVDTYQYRIYLMANQSITVKMPSGLADKLGVYDVHLDPLPPHRMVVRQSGSPDLVDTFGTPGRGYIGGEVLAPNIYDTMQVIIEPLF